jgi:hypothetical protein
MSKETGYQPHNEFNMPHLNKRGKKISWSAGKNSPESDEQIGISNIQALFLQQHEDFVKKFSLSADGIPEDKREDALKYIIECLGQNNKFTDHFGNTPQAKHACPYFEGSYVTALQKSFAPWGILIPDNRKDTTVPRNTQGNILWGKLNNDPEQFQAYIEEQGLKILTEHHTLTYSLIEEYGITGLCRAIQRFYPDGLYGLQKKLGIELNRQKKHFWGTPEGLQGLRNQAKEIIEKEGDLIYNRLRKAGNFTLINAIERNYPGGFRALRKELGLDVRNKRDTWNEATILQAARDFYRENGRISHPYLKNNGRGDLATQINRSYPGGYTKLKKDLGVYTLQEKTVADNKQRENVASSQLASFLEVEDE